MSARFMLCAFATPGARIDVDAAHGAACRLADTLDRSTLETVAEQLGDEFPPNGRLCDLRDTVRRALRILVDDFAESLDSDEVDHLELGAVTLYVTGGLSSDGEAPTAAMTTWARLLDPDAAWRASLTRALGVLTVATATPAPGQFAVTIGAANPNAARCAAKPSSNTA